ncbi:hypothetical protein [Proteus hauseri]|uniref:hypothetical protein n=1 Tax=Proteus hauseri TaxID=183417 RepID=UPI0010095B47|nr:hypothetical protein [Proteus hauseri]QAV23299.1 hypothetical protein PH4a_08110 [Proteus hauseri]
MNDKQNARLAEERLFLIEKFGPLLFFLIPLIILIVGGKGWAHNVLFVCQGIAIVYIGVFYQARKRYLAYQQENAKEVPSRFYRIAWGYILLAAGVEIVLLFLI